MLTTLAVLDFATAAIGLAPAAALAGALGGKGIDAAFLAGAGLSALLAGVAVVAGVGLLQLEDYGRRAQLGLAVLLLLVVPVGTLVGILLLSHLAKPGTRLLFSGRTDLSATERAEVARAAEGHSLLLAATVVGLVLAGIVLVGLLASLALRLLATLLPLGPGGVPA